MNKASGTRSASARTADACLPAAVPCDVDLADVDLADVDLADVDLAEGVRAGDQQAIAEAYLRHRNAILTYARQLCRDPHTAEDLASEAFTRTLHAVHRGGGPQGPWRPYLYTAVRNQAADWARRGRRLVLIADLGDTADRTTGGPAEHAVDAADRSMIIAAFRALPEHLQSVLWRILVEDAAPAQVAAALGTTPGNVNVMVFRAREGLREGYLALHAATDCTGYPVALARAVRRPHTRQSKRLQQHLAACARCRTAFAELTDLNRGRPHPAQRPAVQVPPPTTQSREPRPAPRTQPHSRRRV